MTSTDDLEVPMAWFWAEHLAEDLIGSTDGAWSLSGCEFLAARAVLALTLLFTGIADGARHLSDDELELIRDLISSGRSWLDWCDFRIDSADIRTPCLKLAQQAFRWLLLVSLLVNEETEQSPGTACSVGLKQARRAVHARLTTP
jgi:hypothetical protein